MEWKKAPEELKALLESAMDSVDCEKRPMFGYPAYFINRNMFVGLFQDQLFMRLPASIMDSLAKRSVILKNLEPMPGRPMKDYVVIPQGLYADPPALKQLIGAAADHARTLKPKAAKAPAKKAPAKKVGKSAEPTRKVPARAQSPKRRPPKLQ